MKIFNPNQHQAKKRFGQNFLHDTQIIDRLMGCLCLKENDSFVEIGPGLGAITRQLLPIIKKMDAIELDREIVPKLQFNCDRLGQLTIHQMDALKVDYHRFFTDRPIRVIGNLPYNISTPLLFHLFKYKAIIQDMHFMLQKEVVERMVAEPGSKTYGRLTIMTQSICNIQMLFKVPAHAFTPIPKVESAIVLLTPKKEKSPINNPSFFSKMVSDAFNQRRKTLRNVWKAYLSSEEIEQLNMNPALRPEQITIDEYIKASNYLALHKSSLE
jgi:16S rRNA (adenine1518-N6/adenine1519-N6)-dimethyltransferase